jgi:diacylglycerol kinase (ATP)
VAVVANPVAGGGRGRRLIPKVASVLRTLGVPHRVLVTEGPRDPERLARRAAEEGAAVVAALGGDGQAGACANGVVGTGAALALIPAGTGNDFARHLGLDRRDPLAATRLLAHPTTRRIDLVRVETPEAERFCLNVSGAGFDSEVNELANRIRLLRGTLRYVAAVVGTLARFAPGEFTVRVDGAARPFRGMMLAVGNGRSYGGGMLVCPDAACDDGLLDVCVIGELSRWEFLRAFPSVFRGRHVHHPSVTMLRGREVEVWADRPFQVYADGDRVGPLPARFSVVPGSLEVVVPPGGGRPG